jgi:hypothetical protein
MTISLVQWGRFLFHITHRENIPTVLARGLHCVNEAARLNIRCRSIADDGIQARRSASVVPVGEGGTIHDYVPLFFGARPSMLYAVKFKVPQEDVVYLAVRWNVLELASTVFTDGHAATAGTQFYVDKAMLNQVDQAAVGATIWNKPPELRRKKAAEVLVRRHLPVDYIARLVVRDEGARIKLAQIVTTRGLNLPVDVLPEFYYR